MSDLPPFDPYYVLGVDKTADAPTIKKAYRKLALIKHPDKCTDEALKDLRTDEFQRLNEAYDILGDDEKRKRHDALVRLEALRKEKFSMGGAKPRPFTRSATFQDGYPTGTAYTSRGPTNVEDRAPKGFYEDGDRYTKRQYDDYDYSRRSAGGTTRAERERVRAERDEERRRAERRREEQVKEARRTKYDESDRYAERESRREEPSREKYESWEDNLKAYTTRGSEPRPGMARRTSTSQVPRNIYATRSRAPPKERRGSHEERDLAEQVRREKERLEHLKRQDEERERERREREAVRQRRYDEDREAEKAERQARREREERDRKREQEESERRERERRRRKENVEPYERRPPTLQHNHTEGMLPRVRTEPISSDSLPYPSMARSSTMPSVPTSNSSARRTTGPSKLRDSHQPDSGYSSNSTTNSESHGSQSTAKPVKVTKHYYSSDGTPGRPYAVETHEPRRNTSNERPSSMMANLAKHAARPGASSGHGSASYSLPTRTRSPDRSSRRERDYSSKSPRPTLYGERTPSFDPDGVAWSKPITPDNISYSRMGSGRRAEKDAYPYPSQGFDRRGNMPIPPMSQ